MKMTHFNDANQTGNFNSLGGNLYYETVTLILIKEENQCQNKML